jgi:hypothetical protein
MVTFPVDDVRPATELLPTQPLGDLYPEALAIGGDPALPVLAPNGVHPLLAAVGRAFAEHRPLVLSPDAVWLTIAQGVAQHVRLHAEELRPRLVSHAGRKRLSVDVDGPMPRDASGWQDAVERFGKLLALEVADAELFECDFTTSTEVERVAGRIVLLDVYSPYFAYWMVAVCGIPTITLTGVAEDWRKIRARVDAIAGFGLQTWCRSLVPITDQFVRAAEGDVDTTFWRRIYNPVDAYGGEVITGWAARLYPYLEHNGAIDRPNPLLELPIDEPRDLTVDTPFYSGPGIRSDGVPATLSRANVNVTDLVARDNRVVALHAGLVGVAQDGDGALRPVAGWHLAPATVEIDDVIDRLVAEQETTEPQPVRHLDSSADLVAVYRRIGSATLFDGAWRLLPGTEHRQTSGDYWIVAVIELADGRYIGGIGDWRTQTYHWVCCRLEEIVEDKLGLREQYRLADDPAMVPVYGTSLAILLDAALDSGGDIAHLQTGWLADLARD